MGLAISVYDLAHFRHQHSHHGMSHEHSVSSNGQHGHSHSSHDDPQTNMNVRAAFIHVIGDLIQSVGVLISAFIVKVGGGLMRALLLRATTSCTTVDNAFTCVSVYEFPTGRPDLHVPLLDYCAVHVDPRAQRHRTTADGRYGGHPPTLICKLFEEKTDLRLSDIYNNCKFSILCNCKQCVIVAAAPRHIDVTSIHKDLLGVQGVKGVHDLHVWALNMNKVALSAHLAVGKISSPHIVALLVRFHSVQFVRVHWLCSLSSVFHLSCLQTRLTVPCTRLRMLVRYCSPSTPFTRSLCRPNLMRRTWPVVMDVCRVSRRLTSLNVCQLSAEPQLLAI